MAQQTTDTNVGQLDALRLCNTDTTGFGIGVHSFERVVHELFGGVGVFVKRVACPLLEFASFGSR
jgi:hypothetical protein